jgi:tight adherence protein B
MKNRLIFSVLIITVVFTVFFTVFPGLLICQDEGLSPDQDIISSTSGQAVIKNVDTAGFPNISLYLSFREGSKLGLINLEKEDFKIIENNKEIKDYNIEQVGQTDEAVGVVLVIDTSGSMKGEPLKNAKSAASAFIEEMRETDKTAIVGFSDTATVFSPFTSDKPTLKGSIESIEAAGETALFDGILKGVEQFGQAGDIRHKYLIVLSDGADTVSLGTTENVIEAAESAGITVYCLALTSNEFNPEQIEAIAVNTGGEFLMTDESSRLKELSANISEKIRNQYRITFKSNSENAASFNTSIFIEKLGLKDSFRLSYESPFSTLTGNESKTGESSSEVMSKLMVLDKWWIKLATYILIFVSVTIFIYVISTIMVPNKQDLKTRTDNYLYNLSGSGAPDYPYDEKKRRGFLSGLFKKGRGRTDKKGFSDLFEQRLRSAGMSVSGSKFIFIHMSSVVVLTLAVFLITKNFLITFCVVILVIFMPFLFINFKTAQKLKKFNEQLPDTLQLIEGALKAGYSLNQSLAMVIKETKPPISEEFTVALNEIRMGLDERTSLENMAKRINSELFDWVVLAINIQREVGGNLAEIMDIIANTIREKERILRQIKSLTAEGKLSAYVLIGLPVILGIALSILNREYIDVLFTTKIGFLMLFLAALLMLAGIVWIMRIIKIEY